MTIKRMNEQQLSEWFKASRKDSSKALNDDLDKDFEDYRAFSEASSRRLAAVEKIADSNFKSATHQTLLNLSQWNQALSSSISQSTHKAQASSKTLSDRIFAYFMKPAMALAFVLGFVVVLMQDSQQANSVMPMPEISEHSMFTSSFDSTSSASQDVISKVQFDSKKSYNETKTQDLIISSNFG